MQRDDGRSEERFGFLGWLAGIAILATGATGFWLLVSVRHEPPQPRATVLAAPEAPGGPPSVQLQPAPAAR